MGEIRRTVIYENEGWEVYKHYNGMWEMKPKQQPKEGDTIHVVLSPQELTSLLNILTRINLDC